MTVDGVKPSDDSGGTSSTLLASAKAKDQEAWRKLVYLYSPLVYRWCRQAGLQDTDASDVGQDVFRAVATAIGRFQHDRDRGSFRGWLRTITRNKLRDVVRRRPPGGRGRGGSDAQDELREVAAQGPDESDDHCSQDEGMLVLRRAAELVFNDCEDTTRHAFWRVVIDGQAPADVASDLGLTVNAVYLIKSRLLRRIRDEFAELVDV